MLFLLSPAKTLDYESPVPAALPHSLPEFTEQAGRLAGVLRRKSPRQLSNLMEISDALAVLNAERFAAWSDKFTARNSRQAVLAFNGDVYEGLRARELAAQDLDWAQAHVRILSGLYGVLRPLDRIQPYRLEMGTPLKVGVARNLYQFWGPRVADRLDAEVAGHKVPVIVNLASVEYFRSVDRRALKAEVIECIFEESRAGGPFRVVSFSAKRARGLMARHAIIHRLETPRQLQDFRLEGYEYAAAASTHARLVFRRRIDP